MPRLTLVTRIHVLSAIKVHDQRGAGPFLAELGVEQPGDLLLVERGRRYDAAALLAHAHRVATGEAVAVAEVADQAAGVLARLDFTLSSRADAIAASTVKRATVKRATVKRATAPKRPASGSSRSKPDPVVAICPRCFMQLPATGICNYCD